MELYLQSPISLHDMHKDNFVFTFASREHVAWEKYVANVGTWDTYALVFNSLFIIHVIYYRGQSRFHRDFRYQVDVRYSHPWHEIPSSVTATVDKQYTSAF